MRGRNDTPVITALGSVSVQVGDQTIDLGWRQQLLIATLVATGPETASPDRIAAGVWGDELPKTWKASLRNLISVVNRKVADQGWPGLINSTSSGRRLTIPIHAVDVWRLYELKDGDLSPDEIDLITGRPFGDCEITPMLQDAEGSIAAHRRDLLEAYVSIPRSRLTRRIQLLLETEGIAYLAPEPNRAASERHDLEPLKEPQHSERMQKLVKEPFLHKQLKLENTVNQILARKGFGCLVTGHSGSGKSTVAAEIGSRLGAAGHSLLFLSAPVGGQALSPMSSPFDPFIAAVPGLGRVLKRDRQNTEDAARIQGELIDYIGMLYSAHPLCIIVDNVQWLEREAQRLLVNLASGHLEIDTVVIAAGRTDQSTAPWPDWSAQLEACQLEHYAIERLTSDDLRPLISSRLPNAPIGQQRRLADQVQSLSSGIPGVAAHLVDRIDTRTHRLPDSVGDYKGFGTFIAELDEIERQVLGLISILGLSFSSSEVSLLGEIPKSEVAATVAKLVDRGFVVLEPTGGLTTYRLLHVLLAQAALALLDQTTQRELHVRASNVLESPTSRAVHTYKAFLLGYDINSEDVARLLLQVAHSFLVSGNYWRSAELFHEAREMAERVPSLTDGVAQLEAMDRAGLRSADLRFDVVSEAVSAKQYDLALAAALTGLPEVSNPWGDPQRVVALSLIDPDNLDRTQAITWACELSGLRTLLGDYAGAKILADRAAAQAETPAEKAKAWLAKNSAGYTDLSASGEDLDWIDDLDKADLREKVNSTLIASKIALGRGAKAYEAFVAHAATTRRGGVVHWRALLAQAAALTDQGRIKEAREIAEEAFNHGLKVGVWMSHEAHLALQYLWEMHRSAHGALAPMFDDFQAGQGPNNLFFDAGRCAAKFASSTETDSKQQFAREATMLCTTASDLRHAADITALLADSIAYSRNTGAIAKARETMLTVSSPYLVAGSNLLNLGPVTMITAKLTASASERSALLEEAVSRSDEDGLALWQVACRADLASEMEPNSRERAAIIQDATVLTRENTWLMQVLEGRLNSVDRTARN